MAFLMFFKVNSFNFMLSHTLLSKVTENIGIGIVGTRMLIIGNRHNNNNEGVYS